jgi:predicted LPLAT superfamily acyltransferase
MNKKMGYILIVIGLAIGLWGLLLVIKPKEAEKSQNVMIPPPKELENHTEKENIKEYMDGVMKEKKINIIAINEETKSHIIELHKAFTNNELVVMHGDRFRDGAKTITVPFFGTPAKFPAGPFIMAAKFGVPLCIAFAVKVDNHTYEFSIEEPIIVDRVRGEVQLEKVCNELAVKYVSAVEKMVLKHPHQWFNYYDFWK